LEAQVKSFRLRWSKHLVNVRHKDDTIPRFEDVRVYSQLLFWYHSIARRRESSKLRSPMPSSPRKLVVRCIFNVVPARDKELCDNLADYSAEFVLPDGRSFFLEFCSDHLPKASAVAETYIDRIFPEPGLRIACTQFHEIKAGYVPQTEEFLAKLRQPKSQQKYG
jgi:hypothetical protein